MEVVTDGEVLDEASPFFRSKEPIQPAPLCSGYLLLEYGSRVRCVFTERLVDREVQYSSYLQSVATFPLDVSCWRYSPLDSFS